MPEKIIRDPVHDVIALRLEQPVDAMLFRLVNAAEFQRLRRVRQLGMASLAYPGADHSRYSHSLGVMEIARQMLGQLRLSSAIDESVAAACAAAALLHDLGHGPLSHVFERISGFQHEKQTLLVIQNPDSEVHRILREHDRALPDTVARLLGHDPQRDFFQDILSSQLDADRFDYLLRDNLMTGSKYGGFDLRWLVHSLAIDPGSSRLAVAIKGVSAVEAYLQARYHMYRNVYFHKVVRTGEGMVKLALQRGKRLIEQGRLAAPSERDGMLKALAGGQLTLDEFTDLDDIALMNWLKVWSNCDDAVLARLCRGLLNRRLYKTVDLTALDDPARLGRARESAAHAVAAAGGDPEYDIFYDEPSDTPYEIYDGRNPASDIPIQHPDGRLSSFAAISPLTTALSRQLMFRRLHVAPEYRAAVESAVK
ncbi:MAG: HD domain-containing protein [Tepidisphaeraceae bacterium]|jgi:HD superfamily phosphohydrolase